MTITTTPAPVHYVTLFGSVLVCGAASAVFWVAYMAFPISPALSGFIVGLLVFVLAGLKLTILGGKRGLDYIEKRANARSPGDSYMWQWIHYHSSTKKLARRVNLAVEWLAGN